MKKKHHSHKKIWLLIVVLLGAFISFVVLEDHNKTLKTINLNTPSPTSEAQAFNFGKHQFMADQMQLDPQEITNYTVSPDGKYGAAILVENFGGSGTFYYLVGGTNNGSQTVYSDPQSIGDRVIIQSVTIDGSTVTVNFLDRPSNASMATNPTVKKTLKFSFDSSGNLTQSR